MPTATLGYDNESPQQKLERLIGTALVSIIRTQQEKWSDKDRITARACIKYLAYGADSEASRRHFDQTRLRFNHLSKMQSDVLHCCYLEVIFEQPDLLSTIDDSKITSLAP